ncbi:MAG TPA: UDP-N-acetylmuramoyl-tripeptide--D-alanyl-D-alanine ligase [Candidatus Babeliales bacterium]|jgi:UDP-N-acetylmuramoyl-tripeptide--D-alanyl-D-alanine ligase|nr:UDP-N-acetylmuramoyl-tripeptide--D-alanyl-D-alanine ligase [Candidatus Babeliales bacterium]
MNFDKEFISRVFPNDVLVSDVIPHNPSFSIDSRTIQKGDIFVALQGCVHDGHDFVYDAIKKGAAGIIIQHDRRDLLSKIPKEQIQTLFVLVVYDTLQALFECARAWRAQFSYPVVAVTGSLGKTSTKERISHILKEYGMPHLVSRANQNTRIGVALNILRMRTEHHAAIYEVATGNRGDIALIADILRPTTAVVTSIGHQHMEELGSLQDIAHEKRSIFKYFSEDSIGVICGDQALLSSVSYGHPMIKFGSKSTNQIQMRKVSIVGDTIHFVLKIYQEKYTITLKQTHEGTIQNVLAATAIAHILQVPNDVIVKAIQKPISIPGRFEYCTMKNNKGILINDTYNANPEGVKVALATLENIESTAKKIVVLGDMKGLGRHYAPFWHRQIGRFLRKVQSLKKLILVGTDVQWTKKTLPMELPVSMVGSWQEAVEVLKKDLDTEALVLVKGSRSLHLENLVNEFTVFDQPGERKQVWHQ